LKSGMMMMDSEERRLAIRSALSDLQGDDDEDDSDWEPGFQEAKKPSPTKRTARTSRPAKRGRRPKIENVTTMVFKKERPDLEQDQDQFEEVRPTQIVRKHDPASSRGLFMTIKDEYDYTLDQNDPSIPGLIRSRNYDRAVSKAQVLVQSMEEVLFEDDGIGTAPEPALTRPPKTDPDMPGSENKEIEWQVGRVKQLSQRIKDLEAITLKQKDIITKFESLECL